MDICPQNIDDPLTFSGSVFSVVGYIQQTKSCRTKTNWNENNNGVLTTQKKNRAFPSLSSLTTDSCRHIPLPNHERHKHESKRFYSHFVPFLLERKHLFVAYSSVKEKDKSGRKQ